MSPSSTGSAQALISVVLPAHNEEAGISRAFDVIGRTLDECGVSWEIIAVDDGSRDQTFAVISSIARNDSRIRGIHFSRNFGKEAALSAGLDFATGDAVIPMDADLQDPPELVPRMIARWLDGVPVVLAVRENRASDGWLKSSTSAAFYAVHNHLADTPLPPNAGDFRLIDRTVADVVRALPERQRFMKGLLSWPGFPSEVLTYTRPARAYGKTKWNYARLMNLAVEGITSFSTAPLRASTVIGAVFAFISIIYGGFILVRTLVYGVDMPGYASVFVAVVFIGGVQLLSLGILGEYVGRIYMESKHRPVYVVRAVSERPGDPGAPTRP
ncbi:MAG: glycosyltransferase [Hyphomicrobiales bacterium]|nr:MAG: glycosyltransferase [Hyphomicrobiales bacterium]